MSNAILVIDLGLTNCKCIVFSLEGEILGRASHPFRTYSPQPGYVEQDPDEWWLAVCTAMNTLWQVYPKLVTQIVSIGVTGHMHALVAMGKVGKSLNRALILGDQRSVNEAEKLIDEFGLQGIFKITGARMDASMPAAKINWLWANAPEVHKASTLFLGCKDYIRRILTGDNLTDPIDACATSLYDLQKGVWSLDLMKAVRITESQLPEIAKPTHVVGPLLEEPARALGLKPGIPVVLGSGDDIEVLGNGLMEPGRSLEHLGTTGSILTCADTPVYDPEMALELYPHAEPGLWVLGGSITTAGSALAWASQILGYENLEAALSTLSPQACRNDSALIFFPHLLGERSPSWQPLSRGIWIGLTTTHSSNDLMRAAFEGTLFALKYILDRIEVLVGKQKTIFVSAGIDRNENWLKLRANIYNRSLGLIKTTDPTALGAMMLVTVGIGMYRDLREAVERTAKMSQMIEPDEKLTMDYAHIYSLYCHAQALIAPYWDYVYTLRENHAISFSQK
jgi:xylulokinase